MSKPKLTPRERTVLNHFNSEHDNFILELQNLEGAVSEVIDILYLDTVIGAEKETIENRVESLEKALIGVVQELEEHKRKKQKVKRRVVIR